jgi:integrase
MGWARIENGLRKYEGKRGTSFQVLLRVGTGIICETFSTEKRARDRLAELRVGRNKGDLQYKNIRLGQYMDKWLAAQETTGIREVSIREYGKHIRNILGYFNPTMQLKRMSVALIRDFESYMVTKGLGSSTQGNILGTFKRILADAREEGFNVISPPAKRKHRPKNNSKRIKHLEKHELDLLLRHAAGYGSVYQALFTFLAFSGCRISEALPLTWGDIDFTNRKIHISKRKYQGKLDDPKTGSSHRLIEMYEPVYEMLKSRKTEVAQLYLRKPTYRDLDLVFPSRDGGYRAYCPTNRMFKRALRRAGLAQDFSLHDLRHTFASFLFSMTQNLSYIASQLGHSNPAITLKVYTHLLKEDHGQIIEAINGSFATFFDKQMEMPGNI